MANLVIDTNSAHYRYYKFIRYMWGFDPQKQTSLCPYVQTMLWGSIFLVAFSWLLASGWIVLKVSRFILKQPLFESVCNYIDKKTTWLDTVAEGPKHFQESPMESGLVFTCVGMATIVAIVFCVGLVGATVWALWLGATNLEHIFYAIVTAIAMIVMLPFMALYYVGYGATTIWEGMVWLFTNAELWMTIGSWVLYIIACVLSVGTASIGICVGGIWLFRTSFIQGIGRYISCKFNGFNQIRESRRSVRQTMEEEKLKNAPDWECFYCHRNNAAVRNFCDGCNTRKPTKPFFPDLGFCKFFRTVWEKFVGVKRKVGGVSLDIRGPLGLIWSYIVAMKKGVCPTVTFASAKKIQAEAKEAAETNE